MTGPLPQPHEGIAGRDLAGSWLLSLDDRAEAHREALIALGRHLRSACLVGHPAPVVARIWERMSHPVPGGLCAADEVLSGRPDPDDRWRGLGVLLAAREEWAQTDDQYEAARAADPHAYEDAPGVPWRPSERVYYLQYGPDPGDICRWENSSCTALPVQAAGFGTDPAAARDDAGATFTRDSVLGALADSGFTLREPGQGEA